MISEGDVLKARNLWFSVWLHPRRQMQDVLQYGLHKKAALLISLLFGLLTTLSYSHIQAFILLGELSAASILVILVIGSLMGPLLYYVFGLLLGKVGSWYGGNGHVEATRKALVYGFFMPGILLGLVSILLFGIAYVQAYFLHSNVVYIIYQIGVFVHNVASIWLIGIFLVAFAEAQKIKLWRSMLILIAFLGCMAILFIVIDQITRLFI